MANKVIDLWGDPIEVVVSSAATDNASCTVIQTSPPGGGVAVHMHAREDEVLVALEGDYAVYDGEAWHRIGVGQPHYLMRGQLHAWRNIGTTPGRLLAFVAPGGLDLYLEAVAALTLPRDRERFEDLSRMYGLSGPPQDAAPPPPPPSLAPVL